MDKSVLDIIDSLRHQKQGLKTSDVRDIEGIFVVKLRAQNIDSHFFYTQFNLNEDDNNYKEQSSYNNYKKIVRKLHDTGWKNSSLTSSDVSMLGYGCGVSQYTQFFVEDLDMYQVLPLPYLRSFYGGPGDKFWQVEQKHLSGNVLNPG